MLVLISDGLISQSYFSLKGIDRHSVLMLKISGRKEEKPTVIQAGVGEAHCFMSQQCALAITKANGILGTSRSAARVK